MNSLPINLNFFKTAEQFLELSRLDKQYNLMMRKWKLICDNKVEDKTFTFPTWNAEKKILYWTYLNHKHLGTPINTLHFDTEAYQKDWRLDRLESTLSGKLQILENLEAHGYAEDKTENGLKQVIINKEGLMAGSILHNSYRIRLKSYLKSDYEWSFLIPLKHKKVGYYLLYFAAWLVILISLIFLGFQLVNITNLLDSFVWPSWLSMLILFFSLSPAILIVLGNILILIPLKKDMT